MTIGPEEQDRILADSLRKLKQHVTCNNLTNCCVFTRAAVFEKPDKPVSKPVSVLAFDMHY